MHIPFQGPLLRRSYGPVCKCQMPCLEGLIMPANPVSKHLFLKGLVWKDLDACKCSTPEGNPLACLQMDFMIPAQARSREFSKMLVTLAKPAPTCYCSSYYIPCYRAQKETPVLGSSHTDHTGNLSCPRIHTSTCQGVMILKTLCA